ncbi:MAG: hypothetical protein AB7S53_06615 [Thiomonas sp.]
MSGGLIALALASITGLLAVWLWLGQASTVNSTADLERAEQRCEQARFDQRFDSTLAASNPQAAADAARVARDCSAADRLRQAQAAQAASQAEQMRSLQKSLSDSFSTTSSQPKQEQQK